MKDTKNHIVKVNLSGKELLREPLFNKGTAFSKSERNLFKLNGLIPDHISTIEEQLEKTLKNFQQCKERLEKYNFLTDLQNRNETLFYRFCLQNVIETLPCIYTPTVGDAALNYNLQFRCSRGIYISYEEKDRIKELLENIDKKDVEIIVATDGGRILGLGDIGIGGMTIPIGKTSLYTLFGGISPEKVLPIFLDVGTDNKELLNDKNYLGRSKCRINEDEYLSFMDTFVKSVKKVFPSAMLQWEDLLGIYAKKVLDRYQNEILSFNDDIQGTAGVVLAGLLSAMKIKQSELKNEKIAIFGGGAAGLGIAHIIQRYLVYRGLNEEDATSAIHIIDRNGLVYKGQKDILPQHQFFAKNKPKDSGDRINLDEAISFYKITTLIGASAQKNSFTSNTIKALCINTPMPIVFPLSNPDSKAEATPEMIITASSGKAIIATGTKFDDVSYAGKSYDIGQCNNVYIFPAIGLFTASFNVKTIPDEFFFVAGETLSELSPPLLFPNFDNLRDASITIALNIAKYCMKKGMIKHCSEQELINKINETMWDPCYRKYIK